MSAFFGCVVLLRSDFAYLLGRASIFRADRKTVTDRNADVNAEGTLVNYYDVLKAAEAWPAENA